MTLVLETGTGLNPLANSYADMDEALAYVSDLPSVMSAAWLALGTAELKASLLVFSTRVLDQRARWNGVKTVSSSPLRWPRMNVFDCDNLPVAIDAIPPGLKAAVIELALFYASPDRAPGIIAENDGLKRLKIDTIEFEWKDGYDPNVALRFPTGLNQLLCGLGRIGTGRTNFVPIRKV